MAKDDLAATLAAPVESKTETKAKRSPRSAKEDPIMCCLFMATKGTGGLHQFNGVYTVLLPVDPVESPAPRSGKDAEKLLDSAASLTLKPGSMFLRKSVAEKVEALMDETQQAKASGRDKKGRTKKVFSIVCKMNDLPKQPEALQLQIIEHSWDVEFLTSVFQEATEDLAAAANERIEFINSLGSETTLNRLPAISLPI